MLPNIFGLEQLILIREEERWSVQSTGETIEMDPGGMPEIAVADNERLVLTAAAMDGRTGGFWSRR